MTKEQLNRKLAFLERRHSDLRSAAFKMAIAWEENGQRLIEANPSRGETVDEAYEGLVIALSQPFVEIKTT